MAAAKATVGSMSTTPGLGLGLGLGSGLELSLTVLLGEALRHVLERERDQSIVQPAARLQQVRVPLIELDVAHPRDRRVLGAIDLDHGGTGPPRASQVCGCKVADSKLPSFIEPAKCQLFAIDRACVDEEMAVCHV
eukprot:scaffold28388_cov76-Phaeocystis_antarctica.AAC.1